MTTTSNTNTNQLPQVGEFVELIGSGFKNESQLYQEVGCADTRNHTFRCKVVDILTVTDEALNTRDYLPTHRGGSCSDLVDQNKPYREYTQADYATLYSLVTMLITPTGRVAFVDRQGYDYPRYIYFLPDFRAMYADELEEYRADEAQREADRLAAMEACRLSQLAAARERYGAPTCGGDFDKNIKTIIERQLPGVAIRVTRCTQRWHEATNIRYTCPAGEESNTTAAIRMVLDDCACNYHYERDTLDGRKEYSSGDAFADLYGVAYYRCNVTHTTARIRRHDVGTSSALALS